TDEKVNAYTAGWDLTKKLGKGNLYYGLEYVYNKVGSQGLTTDSMTDVSSPDASRYPDGSSWQSAAAYTSIQYPLAKDLSFQGGLRYNHILVDATFDLNLFDLPFSEANINTGALTGSAGLAWQATPILGWKANFSTAFRAPNIDDVGKIFDSEPGSVVVPNPNLKPEYAKNGELGVTLNFDESIKFDVTSYYTVLNDALVRQDYELDGETEILYQGELSNVQAIQNAAKAEVYGVEIGAEFTFSESLKLISHYNVTEGFQEDEDGIREALRHVAPHFGNTHFTYSKDKWKLDASANYNSKFDFEDLAPSQQNNDFLYAKDSDGNPYSPSWYALNLSGEYAFTDALKLNASLQNITDQRYRPYASGIAAAGRNLILAASYSF
ncbi:MAG: hemoglobin/transferrin/lactoferrin receptor protein, partial [Patiriisocius sp.]